MTTRSLRQRRRQFFAPPSNQQARTHHGGQDFTTSRAVAFAAATMMTTSALGMELGEPITTSNLGDPLMLKIPLTEANGWREDQVTVTLSGDSAQLVRGMTAQLHPVASGYLIEVRSARLTKEPYIAITVEVRWPEGMLMRDYDILLDPPTAGHR